MNDSYNNYFTALSWMNELVDTIEERDVLAIVYGYSQDGDGEFRGSINTICKWLKCKSKHTAIKVMDSLEAKGLIIKRQEKINNITFNRYSVNHDMVVQKMHHQCKNDLEGSAENAQGSAKFAPNNKEIYKEDNNIRISSSTRTIDSTHTPTSTPIITSKNKSLKEKLKEKFDFSFCSIAFEDIFFDWLEYKAARKESYNTQRGLEMCYNKLIKMSNNDPSIAQQIVEQSMANNWAGLYELKDGQRTRQTGAQPTNWTAEYHKVADYQSML